jgi:hypothetical protein
MANLRSFIRYAQGLPGHFRSGMDAVEARTRIRQRMADREEGFLNVVERGVFGHPGSPYLPLLRAAGCEFGDVVSSVRRLGVESTLEELRAAGVSATFEEFKGRAAEARAGETRPLQARDFDNPYLSRYYTGTTGGSTGAGTRVSMELDHYAAQAPHELVAADAHGLLTSPTAAWLSVLPSPASLGVMLRRAPFGRPLAKWFTPVTESEAQAGLKDRVASRVTLTASRVFGVPFPSPELVPLDRAVDIARWARRAADEHGSSAIVTHVSCAARVAVAAVDAGFDLAGVVMWAGSEPPTPAKVRAIRESGARWVPGYWMVEAGFIAQGCVEPTDDTDVHLFSDAFALINHDLVVPGSDHHVPAFYLTTLLPTAPKLMLNVEIDDYGVIERRSCGCALEELGYDLHLRQIHSRRKMTGEGMKLDGAEAMRILEEVLPARCGGTPLDYQLVEEEDAAGLTKLVLVVSPSVPTDDDRSIRKVFLDAVGATGPGATLARATWDQANTVQIRREHPRPTAQGKLLPLRVARSPDS